MLVYLISTFYCVNTSYPMDNCFTGRCDRSRQTPEKDVLYIIPAGQASSVHSLGGASILASCPDRVTSVHLFRLARVEVQTRFEFISKFEENAVYSTNLKLIFIWKYIYCVSYISGPLQDLNEALSSVLLASFENSVYLSKTRSWVRGRVSSLQHSFCCLEACSFHDSPSFY